MSCVCDGVGVVKFGEELTFEFFHQAKCLIFWASWHEPKKWLLRCLKYVWVWAHLIWNPCSQWTNWNQTSPEKESLSDSKLDLESNFYYVSWIVKGTSIDVCIAFWYALHWVDANFSPYWCKKVFGLIFGEGDQFLILVQGLFHFYQKIKWPIHQARITIHLTWHDLILSRIRRINKDPAFFLTNIARLNNKNPTGSCRYVQIKYLPWISSICCLLS